MTQNTPDNNILIYRKKWNINIGMVLFGIILVYLAATVIIYLTTQRTTSYEVRMGSILNDTAYTGIAVREEKVVTAEKAGYINYYTTENIKAKAGTDIYAISDSELTNENVSRPGEAEDTAKELTSDQQNSLGLLVQSFTDSFTDESYSDVYSFQDSVKSSISDIVSENKGNYLNQVIKEGKAASSAAADDGITAYYTDGYEGLTEEDITAEMFNKTDYAPEMFYNNMKVSANDAVYKLITSEEWKLVVPVTKKTAKELEEKKSVRIRFKKDNETLTAGLTIRQNGEQYMACLSFNSAMIRYADERFLDIEMILEDQTGLKIPKSALTHKTFYVIPEEYLTQGGNSNESGVMKKSGESYEFVPVTVYYTEESMSYLNPGTLSEGDVLLKPDSNTTCEVKETRDLDGVFNINKGYAVFKQVKILCESEDYYIVEAGNDYGLANYDHIALNSENVKENDIISQ